MPLKVVPYNYSPQAPPLGVHNNALYSLVPYLGPPVQLMSADNYWPKNTDNNQLKGMINDVPGSPVDQFEPMTSGEDAIDKYFDSVANCPQGPCINDGSHPTPTIHV